MSSYVHPQTDSQGGTQTNALTHQWTTIFYSKFRDKLSLPYGSLYKVPFLVLVSHKIDPITIDYAPHRNATKLGSLIHRIIRIYARAGLWSKQY
jgi:hypothetical protein